MKKILSIILISVILFISCNKKDKIENNITNITDKFNIPDFYKVRNLNTITDIIIHSSHSDTLQSAFLTGRYSPTDAPTHHYQIHWDGNIYQTNKLTRAPEHCRYQNETSISIMLNGNYSKYDVNDRTITQLIELGRYLKKYIPTIVRVKGHNYYEPDSVNCPGKYVDAKIEFVETQILNYEGEN